MKHDRGSKALLLIVPGLLAVILILLAGLHDTFEEWDGVMQLFAGREIWAGLGYRGWPSHFWPPLYAVLVGGLERCIDGFWAGKLISLLSAVGLVWAAGYFVHVQIPDRRVTLFTQLCVATQPTFILLAIQAENHMLDALFFCSAFFVLVAGAHWQRDWRAFMVAGLLAGLAGLTRYTSYVLVPFGVIVIMVSSVRSRRLWHAIVFGGIFGLVSLPWWAVNTAANGAPLASWQFLNVGSRVVGPTVQQWWWQTQAEYASLLDIVIRHPVDYVRNVAWQTIHSVSLLTSTGAVALPALVALVWGVVSTRHTSRSQALVLLLGWGLYVGIVAQAFVFDAVLLPWLVILPVFAAPFVGEWLAGRQKRWRIGPLMAIVLVTNCGMATWQIASYIAGDDFDRGQTIAVQGVATALQSYDSQLSQKTIMAVHPAYAFYASSGFVWSPEAYGDNLTGLVGLEGIPQRVLDYVPRFPLALEDETSRMADYLVYNVGLARHLTQFEWLFDADSAALPAGFALVYDSPGVVVLEVRHE